MINLLFVGVVTILLQIVLVWGFKMLPKEKWQIIGAIPKNKNQDGVWHGENLTYYGVFNAVACGFAVTMALILMGSVDVPLLYMFFLVIAILGLCIPSSKVVARIVEKKPCTLSVGGAFFVGIIMGPWIVMLMAAGFQKWGGYTIPVIYVLSAIMIAYAFGEGIGRLACISFGCCYGKPLKDMPLFFRKIFSHFNFIFIGKTKKVSYAGCLEGEKLVPVQAMTCMIYCLSGVIGVYLFLEGFPGAGFIETLVVTQVWRFASEFLRADYRGNRKISAYQIMSCLSVLYASGLIFFLPLNDFTQVNIMSGIRLIWTPSMILFLQGILLFTFLFSGRSQVTGVTMSFYVNQEKI